MVENQTSTPAAPLIPSEHVDLANQTEVGEKVTKSHVLNQTHEKATTALSTGNESNRDIGNKLILQNGTMADEVDTDMASLNPSTAPEQSLFSDAAIEALVESASRYAEEVMTSNDTSLAGRLKSIYFQLKRNPKKILSVEFGYDQENVENADGEGDQESQSGLRNDDFGADYQAPLPNPSSPPYDEPDAMEDRANGAEPNPLFFDYDDGVFNMEQKMGFLVNFWSYVRQFALDSLQITTNYWNALFDVRHMAALQDEEQRAFEQQQEERSLVDERMRESASETFVEDAEKRSQLKRLVEKVKKVVRAASERRRKRHKQNRETNLV